MTQWNVPHTLLKAKIRDSALLDPQLELNYKWNCPFTSTSLTLQLWATGATPNTSRYISCTQFPLHYELFLYFMMSLFFRPPPIRRRRCGSPSALLWRPNKRCSSALFGQISFFIEAGRPAGGGAASSSPVFCASLAPLTAALYRINSSCHFPCRQNNSDTNI